MVGSDGAAAVMDAYSAMTAALDHRSARRTRCACQGKPSSPCLSAIRNCFRPSSTRPAASAERPAWARQIGVDRTERERAARPLQALLRLAAARQRPAQRIGGAHARRLLPAAPRELDGALRRAVVGLVDGELDVDVDARGALELLLGGDERERLAALRRAPGGELGLAERDDVLGEREPLGHAAQAPDRRGRGCGRSPRRAAPGPASAAAKPRHHRQRLAERAPRRVRLAAAPLQLAQQREHVGAVLRRRAARGGGEAHRLRRAVQVPAQLAQVGDAGVGGEVGLAVDHRLQLALGLVVAAELDQRVDAHEGADRAGAAAQLERAAEVVPGERQLTRGREAVRRARCAQHALGPRVEGGIAGVAHALQVRGRERGPQVVAAGAHRALQLGDVVRAAAAQHGALHGGRRGGPAASQREDGEARAERERDQREVLHGVDRRRNRSVGGLDAPELGVEAAVGLATYGNVVRNGFSF